MSIHSIADCAAFLVLLVSVYALVPMAAMRAGKGILDWTQELAPTFVRTMFFFQASAITLGNWRLCHSGMLAALYVAYLATSTWFASREFRSRGGVRARRLFGVALEWADRRAPHDVSDLVRRALAPTPAAALVLIILGGGLTVRIQHPLRHQAFESELAYKRAINLQALAQGDPWTPDGSVAFLAPVQAWSGLGGVEVVRWSDAVVPVVAAAAAAWCAWSWVPIPSVALAAAAIEVALSGLMGMPGELAGAGWAAVFWALAGGLSRRRGGSMALACLMAVSISPDFGWAQASAVVAALFGVALAITGRRLGRWVPFPARRAAALGLAAYIVVGHGPQVSSAPLQHESAARAAAKAARQLPRNKWMAVSTFEEFPFVYGRGWHLSLAEFVRTQDPKLVADPTFRFPYPVLELLVFVETDPLPKVSEGVAAAATPDAYFYNTRTGRRTMSDRATALVEAYRATHSGVEVFAEGDGIRVYRITN